MTTHTGEEEHQNSFMMNVFKVTDGSVTLHNIYSIGGHVSTHVRLYIIHLFCQRCFAHWIMFSGNVKEEIKDVFIPHSYKEVVRDKWKTNEICYH